MMYELLKSLLSLISIDSSLRDRRDQEDTIEVRLAADHHREAVIQAQKKVNQNSFS